ncbi:alkaline shock response membrane anchor protein AmaP [Allonocardiopsis opalescens]|uniref:Uncharacterized protein n=1 Tax=Allonocardiopsis opalescens TaxID=1144618 RepID=A0A2T0PW45_9ACTN|nr:alkaline shock response membrane anchor protein AmaP [Allonocardiopsis opalescens]PRX95743.1 hypothetical protein CLV72_109356 [Allonocardiopsis opalescens]
MSRLRRSARGNRWGLALGGAVLLAAGGAGLALGLGVFGPERAARPVLGPQARALAAQPWFWYAVAAVCVVLALLGLRWLLVQARTESVRRIEVEPDAGGGRTVLPSSAATDAVEREADGYPGVQRARARLIGAERAPRVRMDLVVDEDADVAEVWQRLRDDGLARLRGAMELRRLPAQVRIRLAEPRAEARRRVV